jgi:hypothetical protein
MSQMSTGLSDWEKGSALATDVWGKRELAAFLNVSVSGLNKLIAAQTKAANSKTASPARKLPPGFRVGRLWRWRPSVVLDWVAANENNT